MRGMHQRHVNSTHKCQVMQKTFPCHDVSWMTDMNALVNHIGSSLDWNFNPIKQGKLLCIFYRLSFFMIYFIMNYQRYFSTFQVPLLYITNVILEDPTVLVCNIHDDVIKWKHFPPNWLFVLWIHRPRWIPHTKASHAELWCFLWSASE